MQWANAQPSPKNRHSNDKNCQRFMDAVQRLNVDRSLGNLTNFCYKGSRYSLVPM